MQSGGLPLILNTSEHHTVTIFLLTNNQYLHVSLTEHAILHRRVKKRHKGNITESHPDIEYVPHVMVSDLTAEEINRNLHGTRVEGTLKIIIWGSDILQPQDHVELDGDINNIGNGSMYEIIRMVKDVTRQANFAVYIMKRIQKGDNTI